MNPITRECQDCPDLQEVLSDIDCTIVDLSKNKYNSVAYGIEDCFNENLYKALVHYKQIITARLYNPHYPCYEFSSNELLAKARLLAYKTDCSRCPECEEVIETTTTTTFPPSTCHSSLVEPGPLAGVGLPVLYPYSYLNCAGGVVNGVLTQYQVLNICALENSISINPLIFVITDYSEGCEVVPETCVCATLKNEETDPGVAPYEFSYEDCGSGVFVDIPLLEQASVDICVKRSTLVANFAYSLINNGACVENCPETTTTTLP
jgi:hypothetical protein